MEEKVSVAKKPEDKKATRLFLLSSFGAIVFLILLAIGYRELPEFWQKLSSPVTVVSRQFSSGETTPTITPSSRALIFQKEIEKMLEPLRGDYGIYYYNLTTEETFSINGTRQFQAASLNKLPLLVTLYQLSDAGKINLDTVYQLKEGDKRSGAGSLVGRPEGYQITYRQMAELMGKQSDNTAFNILSRIVGEEKIQKTIDNLGMKNTSFANWEMTPEDIGLLFRKLYQDKIVSDKSRDEILDSLTNTIWETRIPAGIPKGIRVAHKIGSEVRVVSDAGIIFTQPPFVLVIMSENVNEIEANKALPEITAKIYAWHEEVNVSPTP